MGYDTLIFVRSDYIENLKDSPHAVMTAVTHPPMGREQDTHLLKWVDEVADDHNEPRLNHAAFRVYTTFHMDWTMYFAATANKIVLADPKHTANRLADGTLTMNLGLGETIIEGQCHAAVLNNDRFFGLKDDPQATMKYLMENLVPTTTLGKITLDFYAVYGDIQPCLFIKKNGRDKQFPYVVAIHNQG